MRHIPSVRRWRATYWRAGKPVFIFETMAPTKLFARWNARDAFIAAGKWRDGPADKLTLGLIRGRK